VAPRQTVSVTGTRAGRLAPGRSALRGRPTGDEPAAQTALGFGRPVRHRVVRRRAGLVCDQPAAARRATRLFGAAER